MSIINLTILTKEILKNIQICNQISLKKSDINLFTNTLININSDTISLLASNNSIFYIGKMKLSNKLEGQSEIKFLIKTEQFNNILNVINDEFINLIIDTEKLTLQLKGQKSKHQLRIGVDELENFIVPLQDDNNQMAQFLLTSEELNETNKTSLISVGSPKNMYDTPYLNICYTLRPSLGQLVIVSTDRFRITRNQLTKEFLNLNDQVKNTEFTNFLIPPNALKLVANALTEKEIKVRFESEFCFFEIDENHTIISRYGDGKFSDYEKIIPQSFSCSFVINTEEFLSSLKQVYWCIANDVKKSVQVKLDPVENILTLSAININGEESNSEVKLESYEGNNENWTQYFSADYLKDYLSTIKTPFFLWESNPNKPIILSPKDQKNSQFYLVGVLR